MKLVSIVTPFFNESDSIELYYQTLEDVLNKIQGFNFELIFIDDGSVDNTLAKLISISKIDKRVIVIELSRNFGKESALTAGIESSRGDAVIPFDADLQDPPEVIPKMIRLWELGHDIVLARRIDRSTDSLAKKYSAKLFYSLIQKLSRTDIPENVGDFRLLNRKAVDALALLNESNRFMKGIFSWVGFKTATLDYKRNARNRGISKFSAWKLISLALEGITSFSAAPLRFSTYTGILGATISIFYALYIIVRTLIFGIVTPGYSSLIVAILFSSSIQLIGMGVLGEYIGKIYIESKRRPKYIVREIYRNER
ncbi:glycosyltransferase involved in cell wall biosynthesis [Polynucleobacter sphagniphilus]|uniref:glycosyltransferase family 2 protein n=1 Tax=Polynucleobacter sphagniphilus TaxID=1743169 RepID=UPI002475DC9C|nr:glycosyltransferase family 2 protein [Polynucleobacter sphagniphilus]MDH6154052.1 glycosyltransferase involved in cell wall biosynthesis [Polynucleobacter sphagniphilus]